MRYCELCYRSEGFSNVFQVQMGFPLEGACAALLWRDALTQGFPTFPNHPPAAEKPSGRPASQVFTRGGMLLSGSDFADQGHCTGIFAGIYGGIFAGMGQLVALDMGNCYGAMPLFSNVFHISTILMEFHFCDSRLDVIL